MSDDLTTKDVKRLGEKWLTRIRTSEENPAMKRWFESARNAEAAYLCSADDYSMDVPAFNILHSNVETIVPSIYNSTPVPDIRPRQPKDPVAKAAGDIIEAMIGLQIDDNRLDTEIEKQAQDAFLAGRGIVRVRFDADTEGEGISNERLVYEVVAWKDYREGPAKKWADVPWVAYRHCLSHEDIEEMEDAQLAALQIDARSDDDEESDEYVWEIWCKRTGNVYFIAAASGRIVKIMADPLGLAGFFPQGEPVQPITATSSRTPVCPYTVYRTLAEEMNTQTKRINAIVAGLKVVGIIAGDAGDFESIAEAEDNTLIPVANFENMAATGGIERAISWWPVDKAITVLRELYAQRDQSKQAIYEITGISDIVRGASNAQETLGAQQIKTKWGSLRIKKMQRMVERQVREIFTISAQIIAQKFSMQTLQRGSGVQITEEIAAFFERPLDNYRIDVESDSTIRADAARNREEMTEFLQGTAQFFSTMAPVVQQAPQATGPIVEMYSSFARQFNLGKQAEDALEQFSEMARQAAEQPQPSPEGERLKAEAEARKAELQLKAQGQQADMQARQADAQIKAQEGAEKLKLDRGKLELDRARFGLEMEKAQRDASIRERETVAIEQDAAGQMAQGGDVLKGMVSGAMADVLGEIQSGNQGLAEMLVQIGAAIRDGNEKIVGAMTAPKQLIRDDNGRPVGVRTVAGEQRMIN